ncbi:MAG: peptidyl-prolyl cis-trans isomerase [Deltaproteobacteria bacterium]|nr:peptidyl-prolyl cis-trans isomerase [Deltaproteobacteria bacterium]
MDIAGLVFPRIRSSVSRLRTLGGGVMRAARAPGVHFLIVGVLLFVLAVRFQGPFGAGDGARSRVDAGLEHGPIVVSALRVGEARTELAAIHHRPPTEAEVQAKVSEMVDEELLFRHALDLGLLDQAPVHRRLKQIASFVSSEEGAEQGSEDFAEADVDEILALGLHRGDLVVRRILADSARRLIRSAVLSREPSEEALLSYLREHPERFRRKEEMALTWRSAEDDTMTPEVLPSLPRRDLARKFGRAFVDALDTAAVGTWQGPLSSTYGRLYVRVDEYAPERVAELREAHERVRAELMEVLADRWLAARLDQLRAGTEVVLPPPTASQVALLETAKEDAR